MGSQTKLCFGFSDTGSALASQQDLITQCHDSIQQITPKMSQSASVQELIDILSAEIDVLVGQELIRQILSKQPSNEWSNLLANMFGNDLSLARLKFAKQQIRVITGRHR